MENLTYKYNHLSWKEVLKGYSAGIFPMGNDDDETISWYETNPRSILPIEHTSSNIHIPRSLTSVLKKNTFEFRVDTQFKTVMRMCAKRDSTWINELIVKSYTELFEKGYAHSIESWQDGKLAGGLYGVAY